MRQLKKLLVAASMIAGMASASPSAAAIYTYNLSNGGTMTIDTVAMTGSIIASDVNATFSGAGLASFTGGFNIPTFGTNISITPGSTRIYGGQTYYSNTNHQQMLETGNYPGMAGAGTNKINLWTYWGTAACPSCNILGDYTGLVVSSSTGGTAVPEPGMLGLMAVGLFGIGFARRRARINVAYKPAIA